MQIDNWLDKKVRIKDSGSLAVFQVVALERNTSDPKFCTLRNEDGIIQPHSVRLSRLELVPPAELRTPAAKAGYMCIGDIRANHDEALEWFAFTMLQAGALFQNVRPPSVTDDAMYVTREDSSRNELLRILTVRGETENGPVVKAALAYYDAAVAWYEQDGKQYGPD